jgi:4'-phosphopantetheinyl transferase
LDTPGLTELHQATVRLYWATLDLEPSDLSRLCSALAPDESARASRYRSSQDRDRFVAARGLLRQILGAHLHTSPGSVRLAYSARGKPHLDYPSDLRFSLSHAGSHLVVAVAWSRQLGVDVEPEPSENLVSELADVVLSPPERDALDRTVQTERPAWFGRMWTRKEAFVKADGRGMEIPLEQIDVMTDPGTVLLFDPGSGWRQAAGWSLRTIPAPMGHAACVAAEGSGWPVEHLQWRLIL